jgi:hypothetical protein
MVMVRGEFSPIKQKSDLKEQVLGALGREIQDIVGLRNIFRETWTECLPLLSIHGKFVWGIKVLIHYEV